MTVGSRLLTDGACEFRVWAPAARSLSVILSEEGRSVPMTQTDRGYWHAVIDGLAAGTAYAYRIDDDRNRPDPASHLQLQGVHGPSAVVDHAAFAWTDGEWKGCGLEELIIYELHIGTFTPEGTFGAAISRLDDLAELGITAIEVMPVAQFPGSRNWGYDGVFPYSVQASYGGPDGLKRFVDACHGRGVAVLLDVVYNHLGPEGNYLWDFGPYFTDTYRTPWGMAVNFDGAYSDEVRHFFLENARHWFVNYHMDGLRLDAVHAIYDMSAKPFLQELTDLKPLWEKEAGRRLHLIAESDRNDSRLIRPSGGGGQGLDAQWSDDFHHALHTVLTGEKGGYYADFGELRHLDHAFREAFSYAGEYSVYRKRRHGNSAADLPGRQFVVAAQNHDQIGNRMLGERLSGLVPFEALKLAAATVITSPFLPLLFMGEEYGDTAPFLYFVSHTDTGLIEAVRKGRKEEFSAFSWQGEPPDPQSEETFGRSVLRWEARHEEPHRTLRDFYRELIRLRRQAACLSPSDAGAVSTRMNDAGTMLCVYRRHGDACHVCLYNYQRTDLDVTAFLPPGRWEKIVDSADGRWKGPGAILPDALTVGEGVTTFRMRGLSCAVFRTKGDE